MSDRCEKCLRLEAEVRHLTAELAKARTGKVSALVRFHSRYDVAPSGCWEWKGAKTWNGYGRISDGNRIGGAHRFSFEVHHGPLGADEVCRHRCDNPGCVNPAHLERGSQADNIRDQFERGRVCVGQARWNAKLSPDAVREIRASEASLADLASRFGISQSTASMVRSGKRWGHVQ